MFLQILCCLCAAPLLATGGRSRPQKSLLRYSNRLTTRAVQHNTLNDMVCYIMLSALLRLHRNSITVRNKASKLSGSDRVWLEHVSVYVQMWLVFDMPVVVGCLESCNYCVTASKHCWFRCCTNSSPEVLRRSQVEERRMDRFFFALWRGTFFFPPVMEGELCKRGESSHRPSLFLFFSMSQCLPA